MIYDNRELRRLWRIELYVGDRNDPDTPTRVETIVAPNAVSANRHGGGDLVKPPEALYFVSWAEREGGPIYRIDNTGDGPILDEPVRASISPAPSGEDWTTPEPEAE